MPLGNIFTLYKNELKKVVITERAKRISKRAYRSESIINRSYFLLFTEQNFSDICENMLQDVVPLLHKI